jgi:hypothetical protein
MLQAGSKEGAGPAFRVDRTEQIGQPGALIVNGASLSWPAIGEFVLLADPHLVLAPPLYRCAGREFRADIRHADGEFF